MPDVSLIIPSYNTKDTIAQCLDSVLSQETDCSIEYVVVDSSTDGTEKFLAERYPQVRVIHREERAWPGPARNIGIRGTAGRYIVFIDADCVAEPGWLKGLLHRLIEEDRPVVCGAIENAYPESLAAETEYIMEFNEFTPAAPAGNVSFIPTADIGYHRCVFEHHGMYSEMLQYSEDRRYHAGLLMDRVPLFFDSGIKVRHLHRREIKVVLRHQYGIGYGSGRVRKVMPLPGRELIKFPWLWVLLPLPRLWRIFMRMMTYRSAYPRRFFSALPLLIPAMWVWAYGFLKGITMPPLDPERPESSRA